MLTATQEISIFSDGNISTEFGRCGINITADGQYDLHISSFPKDVAVVVGQSVIFHCRTDSNASVAWKFIKPMLTATQEISIFSDGNISTEFGRCGINITADGQYDLHISSFPKDVAVVVGQSVIFHCRT